MIPTITESNGKTKIVLELPSESIRAVAKGHDDVATEYRYEACAQAAAALRKHGEDLRAKSRGGFVRQPATLAEAQAENARLSAIQPAGDLSDAIEEIEAEKAAEEEEEAGRK